MGGELVGFHPAFACALLPAKQLTLLTPLLQSIYHPVCSMDWSGTSTATNKAMDSRHRCGQCWGAALHSTASAALQFTLHAATQCNSTAGRLGGMVSSQQAIKPRAGIVQPLRLLTQEEGPSCQTHCRINDYRASSHGYNKHTDSTTRAPR